MEDLENLDEFELRLLLINTIEETMGKDFALGWAKVAYVGGHTYIDTGKDFLIAEIRGFRDKATAILKV